MSYTRIVPRDLFNEASLLKCLGRVALLIHDGKLPGLRLNEHALETGFNVMQNPDTGGTFCQNFILYSDSGLLHHERNLNARDPWPLYLTDEQDNEYCVFNDDGSLHADMEIFQ
jgi:hypothetical protein